MVFFIPQYHLVYEDQFTSVPNAASDVLFSDNPSNASSWDQLDCSGIERHKN